MDELTRAWDLSFQRGENHLFWPNEEVVRFISKFVRKRISFDSFVDVSQGTNPRILDFGCGTGRHLLFLNEMGLEAYGIDISPTSVSLAKRAFAQVLENSGTALETIHERVFEVEGSNLPFDDGFFDHSISHGVLDSMPFDDALSSMAELSRVTKSRGLAYIDLIASNQSLGVAPGEYKVEEHYENGTIQSYFDWRRIDRLLYPNWELVDAKLVNNISRDARNLGSRFHLVALNQI